MKSYITGKNLEKVPISSAKTLQTKEHIRSPNGDQILWSPQKIHFVLSLILFLVEKKIHFVHSQYTLLSQFYHHLFRMQILEPFSWQLHVQMVNQSISYHIISSSLSHADFVLESSLFFLSLLLTLKKIDLCYYLPNLVNKSQVATRDILAWFF